METAIAIAVAVGAVAFVFVLNRKSEAATAMQIAAISKQKSSATLGAGDLVTIGSTVAATVYGGPKAGAAAFTLTGGRL